MKTYAMKLNGSGNEIGRAKGENPTEAAEKIWERHCDELARRNPWLEEVINREVPWVLVSVFPV